MSKYSHSRATSNIPDKLLDLLPQWNDRQVTIAIQKTRQLEGSIVTRRALHDILESVPRKMLDACGEETLLQDAQTDASPTLYACLQRMQNVLEKIHLAYEEQSLQDAIQSCICEHESNDSQQGYQATCSHIVVEREYAFRMALLEFEQVYYRTIIAAETSEQTIAQRVAAGKRDRASASLSRALQDLFRLGHDDVDLVGSISPDQMTSSKRIIWKAWVQAEWDLFTFRGGSVDPTQSRLSLVMRYFKGYTTAIDRDVEATKRDTLRLFEDEGYDKLASIAPQHSQTDKVDQTKEGNEKKKTKKKEKAEGEAALVEVDVGRFRMRRKAQRIHDE